MNNIFRKISVKTSNATGKASTFVSAFLIVLLWAAVGPVFGFSDTWQLVINTSTTIVTFLMVFLIQRTQNKDSKAVHLKLNELIASLKGPSNRLINVEELNEEEIRILSNYFQRLSEMAKKEQDLSRSHSIEEAEELHKGKYTDVN